MYGTTRLFPDANVDGSIDKDLGSTAPAVPAPGPTDGKLCQAVSLHFAPDHRTP